MEFNIETIKGLKEGATYIIEFAEDIPIEECINMTKTINNLLKEHNRDILFIYMRKCDVEIKGEIDYGSTKI